MLNMISLLGYFNNFLLYFVNTFYSINFIEVIKDTLSKSRVLSIRRDLSCYRPCNAGIIASWRIFIYALTLISWSTISFFVR